MKLFNYKKINKQSLEVCALDEIHDDVKLVIRLSFLTPSLQVRVCADYIEVQLKEYLSTKECEVSFCKYLNRGDINVKCFIANPLQ